MRVYETATAPATPTQCCFCFRPLDSKIPCIPFEFAVPMRVSEVVVVLLKFHNLENPCLAFRTADLGFLFLSVYRQRKKDSFQAFLSYRKPRYDLLDDVLKVVCRNDTCFAEYQMTFWLDLPKSSRKNKESFSLVRRFAQVNVLAGVAFIVS